MNENMKMQSKLEATKIACRYLSWHGIFAGVAVAIGLTFLFNLLTVGLGLSLATRNDSGATALAFGGIAWMIVGSYIVLFIPGWVSGRIVSQDCSMSVGCGLLHGFVTWSIYLMLSWVLLSFMTDELTAAILHSLFVGFPAEQTAAAVNDIQTANRTGYAGLLSFVIFLVGALGCTIGGACGVKDYKRGCVNC